ncbi:ABC transporter substrate-binding protein [Sulfitobacter donghicola]|uniref:Sugar ABC transporter substrate-binding protein n=1 Tax=Sulfitobacter donghicola DSW-25 = KCTC 12864 = JCM 14565 TaxID=1300350 RepID=A0A073IHB6_9RHOB|nr:ABC transporter substrate-binding protein [Sulfitobacter donghicola]KEJ88940.1 sugar ABC transporter substrate-binding protein [Sulfitobacter donghicola DSW-25 = KCTC 12864 = JCM 14565]KIN67514.1 Extracellular solute-binding protein, family 1 [Sulfitobacter donghicola DSW-25 = KCTC 12864 = JCM 14565]
MHSILKTSLAALIATGVAGTVAFADTKQMTGDLKITSDMSNPAPRAVMEGLVAGFQELHPKMNIELTIVDREAWKTQIRNALGANPPDVVNWYAANRMGPYVSAGLFEDISDMYTNGDLPGLDSVKGAMTIDGKQYGVPYTYYQWGIYYREDIFKELGLSEPVTFDEELANCEKIVASGRACYAIGTKFLWTAGGWFDYMNMRTNGFDFHMQLARGEVEWTDPRVRETFANWRKIIDMGGYIADHQSYSWQEALTSMTDGEATAYLIGNFAVAPMRDAGLDDSQIDFYQFPKIADVPQGEDAPTDTFHIPSGATNKENARAFLQYVTSADVQTDINSGDKLGQLPVNAASGVDADEFLEQGFDMLSNNAKGGVAQFFDRDFTAEMASVGMEGLQEFMVFPDNLDDILERLEDARQRIYK